MAVTTSITTIATVIANVSCIRNVIGYMQDNIDIGRNHVNVDVHAFQHIVTQVHAEQILNLQSSVF